MKKILAVLIICLLSILSFGCGAKIRENAFCEISMEVNRGENMSKR